MKHLSLLLLILTLFACNKETAKPEELVSNNDPNIGCTDKLALNYKSSAQTEDCSCQYDFQSTLSNVVPESFTQKVLIEEHSGTWCGWCPLSKETIEKLSQNPNIVGVEIHYNDKLTVLDEIFVPLKNVYGYPAWPSGMINRKKSVVGTTTIIGEPDWKANTDAILSKANTSIGIALDAKLVGNEVQVFTKTKFINAENEGKFGIGIYLVEDQVENFPQLNYLSGMSQFKSYKAYYLPGQINDIKHYNVARGVISPIIGGFEIPEKAKKDKVIFPKLFKYKLPASVIKLENCKIVAFVMNEKNEILNVNYCNLGNLSNWN